MGFAGEFMIAALLSGLVLSLGPGSPTTTMITAPETGVVRLGDVAELSEIPATLRERARDLVLLDVSDGRQVVVTRSWIARRARAAMPALTFWFPEPGATGFVQIDRQAPAAKDDTDVRARDVCVRSRVALAAGESPSLEDLVSTACPAEPVKLALTYNRERRVVTVVRAVAAGDPIAAPPPSLVAAIDRGQEVYVRVRVGPVTIERRAEALQAARAGEGFFVRTAEGGVLAIPAGSVQ